MMFPFPPVKAAEMDMPGRNRRAKSPARLIGRQRAAGLALDIGAKVKAARVRRRWTQQRLGERVGLSSWRIGQIERGRGAGASIELLCSLAAALELPIRVEFGRDVQGEPADAGHLKVQELALRLGRKAGRSRTFELATKPLESAHSIDVFLRDDDLRILFINECWNTFSNINASVRSTRRKVAEAEQLAVAVGGDAGPYRVAAVWIVRDTRANRTLIARYPEVFAAAFTGASAQWAAALMQRGAGPPQGMGLVWCDVAASRVFPWRRPRAAPSAP